MLLHLTAARYHLLQCLILLRVELRNVLQWSTYARRSDCYFFRISCQILMMQRSRLDWQTARDAVQYRVNGQRRRTTTAHYACSVHCTAVMLFSVGWSSSKQLYRTCMLVKRCSYTEPQLTTIQYTLYSGQSGSRNFDHCIRAPDDRTWLFEDLESVLSLLFPNTNLPVIFMADDPKNNASTV